MEATVTRIADRYDEISVEGDRTQLVDGQVVVSRPRVIHAQLQLRLGTALHNWTEAGASRGMALLPTDVRMDEYNVYGPDLLWFQQGRIPANLDGYPEHVPDLCAEIRSPTTWRHDVGAKKRVYEEGGLAELWLVDDVAHCVLVYRRSRADSPTFRCGARAGPR